MNKQLLKEIQKLKYLNNYNRGITVNENKVLNEQLGPFLVKTGFANITEFGLEQAIKLNLKNLPEIFGKDLVDTVETLLAAAVRNGRLKKTLIEFNGVEISGKLALFRKWVKEGSTQTMSNVERNIFYEALATIDETFNKNLLAEILETAEGKLLKGGTLSDEALEKLTKDVNSTLYGFSEGFLRQVAKTSGGMVEGINKKLVKATEKLGKAAERFGRYLKKSWNRSGAWIGGTGLFKAGPAISSQIRTSIVEKHIAKLANYEVSKIPAVLQRLGLSNDSIQQVIKAIQQKTAVPSKVMEEIYAILVSRGTPELEKIFNIIYKDLSKSKWFKKDILNYLDKAFMEGTEDLSQKQIAELKKLLGLPADASDELAVMLMKSIKEGSGVIKVLRKVWYKPGTDSSRFMHWVTCKGGKFKGFFRGICVAFKLHLLTSLTPFINKHASIKAIWDKLVQNSKETKDLETLKDILNPQAAALKILNDPTRYQFLQPEKDTKTVEEINEYYDKVAEAIGTLLLTFVPTDAISGLGVFPDWYFREDPEDKAPIDEVEIDINSVYGPNTGNGRWYIGPFISELNKATDNAAFQFVLASISSDWNNIDEARVANLLTSRPSRFGIAKVAERYKELSGRSLWGDLDQLEMGDGLLQNFVNNFLFVGDIDKHNLPGLQDILRKPEYSKNDAAGATNIVMDPKQFIWDEWWEFPEVLYDIIETTDQIEEVEFKPEWSGYMPLDLMLSFQMAPEFIIEGLDGNKFSFKVETEDDLYEIPAKAFNDFLKKEALAPYNQDIYHHRYIYTKEVVGYDANGDELVQWNRERNPAFIGTPKNTSVKEDIEKKWKEYETKVEDGDVTPENETNDGN